MILELPRDLQSQVEELAAQRGTDAQAIVIEKLRAGIGATTGAPASASNGSPNDAQSASDGKPVETRVQRRARISAAIDEAQRHFAPLMHGGDAVGQLMAEKRADTERAAERGL